MAAGDGLVQGAWTESSVKDFYKATCTVTYTTQETDAYTVKTPDGLDGSKPFVLFVSAAATPDGQALPLKLWIGNSASFALSGQGASVAATGGAYFKQLTDDCVLAVGTTTHAFLIDPQLPVADVVTVAAIATGYKVRVPASPYYAFHLDGGSTLNATNTTFTILQKA